MINAAQVQQSATALPSRIESYNVVSINVAATTIQNAASQIVAWGQRRDSRYVCVANVHMAMEAFDDAAFREVVNTADLTVPDGAPLSWVLRLLGIGGTRICGRDLVHAICHQAARSEVAIGLYGGSPEALAGFRHELQERYPQLRISYAVSPPYRALSTAESKAVVEDINRMGVGVLLVGLGCPKQERWMNSHRHKVHAAMVGVGAAFDFLAGLKPTAPKWMQRCGLEWVHRLCCEPTRLWSRYLHHNPRFVKLAGQQIAHERLLDLTSGH